jgi:hypothetical protein
MGHRERRAKLHRGSAQAENRAHFLVAVDSAGGDEGDALALQPQLPEARQHRRDRGLDVEARTEHIGLVGRAEMPARVARMLQHDRIRQAFLAHPLAQQQAHAARVGQDGNQRDLPEARGELRQVERQSRAHHHRLRAALAGLAHVVRVLRDRAHHVHRDQAAALRERERRAHLPVERLEVGGVDRALVARAAGALHEVGMQAAQVDARDGADGPEARHAAGEPVRGHADAHAALDDRQQPPAADREVRQRLGAQAWSGAAATVAVPSTAASAAPRHCAIWRTMARRAASRSRAVWSGPKSATSIGGSTRTRMVRATPNRQLCLGRQACEPSTAIGTTFTRSRSASRNAPS